MLSITQHNHEKREFELGAIIQIGRKCKKPNYQRQRLQFKSQPGASLNLGIYLTDSLVSDRTLDVSSLRKQQKFFGRPGIEC